jgi:hypothetical protein
MEGGGMKIATLLAVLAVSLLAGCATLGIGSSWREEVELHDGRKIVVHRSQTYGGMREIGQSAPIRTQEIDFTVPEMGRRYHFESEYSEDVGRANLKIIALHIKDGIPYLVTSPNLCLAYNKWGRPNPPYVIFRHDGTQWQRIALAELPSEFKTINLVVETKHKEPSAGMLGVRSAAEVREINRKLPQKEFKGILREPLPQDYINVMCMEMIPYRGSWVMPNDEIGKRFIDQQAR